MTDDPHRLRHLRGCHPELKARVRDVVRAMLVVGHHIILTQGVRSLAQQQALYAQGRTKPGKIVTNCDGVRHRSNHQVKADGYGYAVDVAWQRDDGTITWEGPWALFGQIAVNNGLIWGGRWISFPDRPHLEWCAPTVPTVEKP